MNIKNTALLTRGFFLAAMLSFGVGSAVPAHGATVVFSGMTDQQGNPLNADVSLNMAAQPIYNGTGLSFGDWVTYPMTNYTVTVSNLIGGYYMMSMPGLKKQLILSVPNSTNTYQFMSLVTNVLSTIYQSINYFNGTNFVSVYSTNGFGGLLISGDTNPANLNITLSQSLDALSKQQFSWLKTTNANSTGFWIMSTPGSSDGGLSISLDYDLSKGIAIQPATVSSNLYQHDSTTIGMLPGFQTLSSNKNLTIQDCCMMGSLLAPNLTFGFASVVVSGWQGAYTASSIVNSQLIGIGIDFYSTNIQNSVAIGGYGTGVLTANQDFNNIFIGSGASENTGSNNIVIGYGAGGYSLQGSSNIVIGASSLTTDTNIVRIGSTQTATILPGVVYGNGSGITYTNAAGKKFLLIVNTATNGFTFVAQ